MALHSKAQNLLWTANVKKQFKKGENELHIVLRSPINEGLVKYDVNGFEYPGAENDQAERGEVEGNKRVSIYTRKAGYHFGWDWGPRFVTSGLWKSVFIEAWNEGRILNTQIIQQALNNDEALLKAVVELDVSDLQDG